MAASPTVATQLHRHQHVDNLGEEGHIRIHMLFSAPLDLPVFIEISGRGGIEARHFRPIYLCALRAGAFTEAVARYVRMLGAVDEARRNMRVIDALFASVRPQAGISVAARQRKSVKL